MRRNDFKAAILFTLFILWVTTGALAQIRFEEKNTVFFASNPMSDREVNVQDIYIDTEECRRRKHEYLNSRDENRNQRLYTYLRLCMNPNIYEIRQAFIALMQEMSVKLRRSNILADFVTYPYKNQIAAQSPISGLMTDLNNNLSLIVKKRIEIEYRQRKEKLTTKEGAKQVKQEEGDLDFFADEEDYANWEFEWNEQIRNLFNQTYHMLAPSGEITEYDFNGLEARDTKKLSAIFSHFYFIKQREESLVRRTIRFRLFLYDLEAWTGEDNDIHPLYFKITSKSDYTQTAGGYTAAVNSQLKSILDDFVKIR
jgi:hypothetical protein